MLSRDNLEQFTKTRQTGFENVVREYCQHLFLTFLYQQPGSERLQFKGGTALRIVFGSPRFSEDLDFTGVGIRGTDVESLFTDTLAAIERTGVRVQVDEAKATSGGYLGRAIFSAYGLRVPVQIEISLRGGRGRAGTRALIASEYLPAYTLVHEPVEQVVRGKLDALRARHKPRDFYDFFFLLSGNFPLAKEPATLRTVRELLRRYPIDFRAELKKLLPASHAMHLRDFRKTLERKLEQYL